jgi:polyphosphate kinase
METQEKQRKSNAGLNYRESALQRVQFSSRICAVVEKFINKGFFTRTAFFSVVRFYFPEIEERTLDGFWHIRFAQILNKEENFQKLEKAYEMISESVLEKVETSIENLGHE